MTRLGITLCLFTSTKGHWGSKDLYKTTLAHLDKQCPLSLFGGRLAHIKITPGEEAVAADMQAHLESRGFDVLTTTADWSRGTAHQHGIIQDQRTLSQDPRFHANPFMLLLEDDSPFVSHELSLADLLAQSCRLLAENHEIVSARTLRRGDLNTSLTLVPPDPNETRWFWSPHFNFQPAVLRTRDFYVACNLIQSNWAQVSHLQSELLWRLVLSNFSRSELRHIVYQPDYAETFHIGVPDYAEQIKALNL